MKVTVGEEITKVARPAVGDDHLLDLDFVASIVNNGSECFLVWRVEDVPFPYFLQ